MVRMGTHAIGIAGEGRKICRHIAEDAGIRGALLIAIPLFRSCAILECRKEDIEAAQFRLDKGLLQGKKNNGHCTVIHTVIDRPSARVDSNISFWHVCSVWHCIQASPAHPG